MACHISPNFEIALPYYILLFRTNESLLEKITFFSGLWKLNVQSANAPVTAEGRPNIQEDPTGSP
jgi:hypothetical protein